jgi:hypothetical protein
MRLVHGLGELAGLRQVRLAGFHPDQVAVRSIGDGTGDARLDAVLDLVEAFDRAAGIVVDEGLVALVDIGRQELGGLGIGAGDDQRRVPMTSAARRAALRLRMCAAVGISTLPPRWPHFFSDASWSSK